MTHNKLIAMRLPKTLHLAVVEEAERTKRTVSELIREVLADKLQEKENTGAMVAKPRTGDPIPKTNHAL